MRDLINDFLSKKNLNSIKKLTDHHRTIFNHQLAVTQRFYDGESWWWVKERILNLSGVLSTKETVPTLLAILAKSKPEHPTEIRQRYLAASAIARLTGKDFRYDAKGKELPINQTAKKYLKSFSK